jgi:Acetyltransferase (GNAT) family
MSSIVRNPSPARLIAAIEENLSSWIRAVGILGRVTTHEPPGVERVITDISAALFNSIMGARLAPQQVDATIQFIVSDAGSRNVPVCWWIGPSTQPADLAKYLERHGFADRREESGMAVDLEDLNESLPVPVGVSIHLAQDDASWRQWSITMRSGSGASSPNELGVNAWCRILRQTSPETLLAYTGWLDGTPVATSLLFLAAGVAGIYNVVTIPEARRKGIGAMMTLHPLRQARSMGYRAAVLVATEMGRPVYHSLGFREYCKVSRYRWPPAQKETAG